MKKDNFKLSNIMDCRAELFGLSAIIIIYHHLSNRGIPGSSVMPSFLRRILEFVLSKGNIGVDVFILLSAVGLYYSMSRNSVKQFFLHRFSRVFITWLVIMIPVFIYEDFVLSDVSAFRKLLNFLLDSSTLRYWIDNTNTNTPWFVPFIIVLYVVFPVLFILDKKTKKISTLVLFFISIGITILFSIHPNELFVTFHVCISRIPVFLFGVIIAGLIKNEKIIPKWSCFLLVLFGIIVYVLWFFIELPLGIELMYGSIVAVCVALVYSFIRNRLNVKPITKFFALFGSVSLEIYLVHTVILRIIDKSSIPDLLFASMYIILPLVSLGISKIYSMLTKKTRTVIK